MRVWIEPTECMGAGTCEQIAPQVFADAGDGTWTVKEDARHFGLSRVMAPREPAKVPEALIDLVIDAAEQCPAECIFIDP